MFGFGAARKNAPPVHERSRIVGLDLNAARARAVSAGGGKLRTLLLDGTAEELRLMVHLDRRPPEVGRAAVQILRKLPHAVAAGFLPLLGHPTTWPTGKGKLTPEAALALALDRLRGPLVAESDAVGVVLPTYLTPAQVTTFVELATKAKLPVRGTASAALAIAAHRAAAIPLGTAPDDDAVPVGGEPVGNKAGSGSLPPESDWVVPGMPDHDDAEPGAVVIVDADDAALTAAAVAVTTTEVRLVGSAAWPKLSLKAWTDRILDGVSDRCVRVCRRDPRDSAEAEQFLFEQLPDALDLSGQGHPVTLVVRSAHWYQDLPHRPPELDAYCTALAKAAADGVRELLWSLPLPVPPRAIWVTAAAARLPGLGAALFRSSPEWTRVETLAPTAAAEAAAALAFRWRDGFLPRAHLDTVIPLPPAPESPAAEELPGVPYAERVQTRAGG
ncbi:MAG: hypothetical protein ACRC7O_14500 [Fimbriiglobus sp.]